MDLNELDGLRSWFDQYVASVYCGDPHVDRHLRFKYDHSLRTQVEIKGLAEDLNLSASHRALAEAIGLLHDVGRFEQFARYRTYNDLVSTDHSALGVEVLHRTRALAGLSPQDQRWIEAAIQYHGRRELPAGLDDQTLFFCRLIRDADKLEIFHIVVDNYRQLAKDPGSVQIQLDRPDEPSYSPAVVEAAIRGRGMDWKEVHTLNDIKLMQASWVHDVNFIPSLQRIVRHRYLDQILGSLPDTEDIRRVRDAVLRHVEQRLSQGGPLHALGPGRLRA
jgi:putative nucleotidyltransferase with HDIG domain